MSLVANNAIGWANLQISGGWRRIGWVCAAIAVLLPLIIFGSLQLGDTKDPQAAARALTTWYWILGAAQAGMLLIGVPSRVFATVKRDRLSKVIESHRLMPTPSAHAVFGYVLGSNLFLLSCIATVFALGAFIAVPAQEDWRGWIALHAAAAGISVMLACVVAFTSQWQPKMNPALFSFFIGPLIASRALTILPSPRVLFAPYFGSGFEALRLGHVQPVHVIAFGGQALIAAILFIGACRRYRRDDVPALGFGWGLVLLTTWVALGLIGMRLDNTGPFATLRQGEQARISFIGHVTLTMLFAIGPIVSAAAAALRWRQKRLIDPYFVERRPAPLWAAAICVSLSLLAMLIMPPQTVGVLERDAYSSSRFAVDQPTTWVPLALTGGLLVLFVITIALLGRGSVRLRLPSAAWLIAPWIFLTWVLPPILDAIAAYMSNALDAMPRVFSSVSPPVCLGFTWTGHNYEAEVGLLTQAGLIVLLVVGWTLLKQFNSARLARVTAAAANRT